MKNNITSDNSNGFASSSTTASNFEDDEEDCNIDQI